MIKRLKSFKLKKGNFYNFICYLKTMNITTENSLFNCSGYSNHHKEAVFCGLFDDRPAKVITVTIAFLLTILSIAMYYSVIWYEHYGTDNNRTLVNKLLTSACWIIIANLTICSTDIIRPMVGPLPKEFCIFQAVSKNILKACLTLCFDAIVLTRYVIIFWLKNPTRLHDEFWSCFINFCIFISCTIVYLTKYMLPGKWYHYIYTCAGITNSEHDKDLPYKLTSLIEIPTVLLYVVISVRIAIYKRSDQAQQKSNIRWIFQKSFYLNFLDKEEIAGNLTSFLFVLGFLLHFIVGRKIHTGKLSDLNLYPNYLCVYFHHILAQPVMALIGILSLDNRHPPMKEKIKNELRNSIGLIWRYRQRRVRKKYEPNI